MADNKLAYVIVGLLLVVGYSLGAFDRILPASMVKTVPVPGVPTAPGTIVTPTPVACPDSSVTMTVGKVQEAYNPSTDVSTTNHRVFTKENGGVWVDQGLFKDAATKSVKVGSSVIIVYAENDTNAGTGTSNGGHYASAVKLTVPCGAFSTAEFDNAVKKESYLYDVQGTYTSRLSVRAYNTNNGNLNSNDDAQSLTSNDAKTMKIEFEGSTEDAISPAGSVIIVIEGNKTAYDQLKLNDATGTEFVKVSVPPQHQLNNTNNKIVAYKLPPILSSQIVSGTLFIDTANTDVGIGGDSNITINAYDENYWRDTNGLANTGQGCSSCDTVNDALLTGTTMFFGVADNDNNDVGGDEDNGGGAPISQIQVQ